MTQIRDEALAKANAAVQARIAETNSDPDRPKIHFAAPAQWMNDPNGPIFFNGWYHMFYQHNPYGEQWQHMHWGHARSKDMVHWEHLPIALWPSLDKGEEHVYSGSTTLDANGKPIIFYTSIGPNREPEQWAATADDMDLLKWTKVPHVLIQKSNPENIAEWRDPFAFRNDNKNWLLTGGGLHGRGTVDLYGSDSPTLKTWKFENVFFTYPDGDVGNIECPNLVKVGDHWVLMVSLKGHVEAFVGKIENQRFIYQTRSVIADGSYASQVFANTGDRTIYTAWVNTGNHKTWNGYLILPSQLTLSKDSFVVLNPVKELQKLRGPAAKEVPKGPCEIEATVDPTKPLDLKLGGFEVNYDPSLQKLSTNHRSVMLRHPLSKVRVFLDASSFDIYANDGEAVLNDHNDHTTEANAELKGLTDLQIWPLK